MKFSTLQDGFTNTYFDCQENTFKDGNKLQPPSFKIPDLQDGFYRIRYKVDWNCIDPAGNTIANNNIIKNRGAIVDTRLYIRSNNTAIITARANSKELVSCSRFNSRTNEWINNNNWKTIKNKNTAR